MSDMETETEGPTPNPEGALLQSGTGAGPERSDPVAPKFKLALSLPGRDIGGEWLSRLTDEAPAYRSYCSTRNRPQEFTTYEQGGRTYLQDQDGLWLSHEGLFDLLYMSYWNNAVAWRIEGRRLLRESDNAPLTWRYKRWPLAGERNWLQAGGLQENILDVQKVEL
ncbi:hypothetical protein ABH922_003634 [Rhodococcus sp. 27YEA15]|uniref:hypothetical protein n=1 Tax=Rhodococcus sp. 27YEA15 TaxID=3156259 RepID=UPI003C7D4AFA